MFTMKKHISRRAVLRGIGATVALPFLDAMASAMTPLAQTAAKPLMRFGVVFVPLGERPGYWTPAKAGADFEFTPILKPLEPYRNWVTVVSELCNPYNPPHLLTPPMAPVTLRRNSGSLGLRLMPTHA